jgi:hypothetical protein
MALKERESANQVEIAKIQADAQVQIARAQSEASVKQVEAQAAASTKQMETFKDLVLLMRPSSERSK